MLRETVAGDRRAGYSLIEVIVAVLIALIAGCNFEWDRYDPMRGAAPVDAAAPQDLVALDTPGMDAPVD
ncbi:MAG: prepilin-type N-terminal cleavage/methylation domain-containing protein, partial [Elusimicrobiota bacterium]